MSQQWGGLQSWESPTEPTAELVIQRQITVALTALGFIVEDMSQGRATRQRPGIPDLHVWQRGNPHGEAWLEIKRPLVRLPTIGRGGKPGSRIAQQQGKRSWEQEQWHQVAQAGGLRVATVDSVDLAVAFLLHCGYRIPPEATRLVYDPADQARFTNPRAQPRAPKPPKRARRRQGWNRR